MYKAPTNACGLFTSGGTESIGLACLAARNHALEKGKFWKNICLLSLKFMEMLSMFFVNQND